MKAASQCGKLTLQRKAHYTSLHYTTTRLHSLIFWHLSVRLPKLQSQAQASRSADVCHQPSQIGDVWLVMCHDRSDSSPSPASGGKKSPGMRRPVISRSAGRRVNLQMILVQIMSTDSKFPVFAEPAGDPNMHPSIPQPKQPEIRQRHMALDDQ